jgi:hypothetical protein
MTASKQSQDVPGWNILTLLGSGVNKGKNDCKIIEEKKTENFADIRTDIMITIILKSIFMFAPCINSIKSTSYCSI